MPSTGPNPAPAAAPGHNGANPAAPKRRAPPSVTSGSGEEAVVEKRAREAATKPKRHVFTCAVG